VGTIVIVYGGPFTGVLLDAVKVAPHVRTPSTRTVVLGLVPAQSPLQPAKVDPVSATAVSVTDVSLPNVD
jgi:hypothetical protein